jgi:hypothetical protein
MPRYSARRPRRTPKAAGLGTLVLGFILAAAGTYFLTNQVQVGAGPLGGWAWFGPISFGLLLVPLLLGVALLCFNGRSPIGRLLVAGGAVLLLASVLDTLRITFRPTSLFNTLMMLGLSVAGIGLMARTLLVGRDQGEPLDGEHADDREGKEELQGQLASAHERIRALEAPQSEKVESKPLRSVDDELAELVRLKRNPPAT